MKYILPILLIICSFSCKKPDCSYDIPNCSLSPEAGPCEAYIQRYYYDKQSKSCKEFIWRGCGGQVPFESIEDCEACLCTKVN